MCKLSCPYCKTQKIHRKGRYFIKFSRSFKKRYQCSLCLKTFSQQTLTPTYRQKKPYLNCIINSDLVSGLSQRHIARRLNISRKTVDLKLLWLSLNSVEDLNTKYSGHILQIDEMETIEHTKLKPLTIPLCVTSNYEILGITVGQIPAKGFLAELSFKKYGYRENERLVALRRLFSEVQAKLIAPPEVIITDEAPIYTSLIKEYFPQSVHKTINSRRQVEKKREQVYSSERKKTFDPMFALNQRCAKLRDHVKRLARRNWCTTKKSKNLERHLKLYQFWNNQHLPLKS